MLLGSVFYFKYVYNVFTGGVFTVYLQGCVYGAIIRGLFTEGFHKAGVFTVFLQKVCLHGVLLQKVSF